MGDHKPTTAATGIPRRLDTDWATYRKLAVFLKPYRLRLVLGLLAGAGYAACNSGLLLLVRKLGDTVFQGKFDQSAILNGAGAAASQGGSIMQYLWWILLIPPVMILRGALSYANVITLTGVSLRALRDMRRKLFSHLMGQSLDFFGKAQTGRLLSRVVNDTQMAQESLVSVVGELAKQPLTAIGVIIILLRIDWKFCLFASILFPLFLLPVIIYGRKVRKAARAVQNETGVMAVILQESFAGVRVIKAFAREAFQIRLFERSSEEQFRAGMRVKKSTAIIQPMMESASAFGVALALLYVYYSHLSTGSFMALLVGLFLLYDPIKNLSRIHVVLQNCLGSAASPLEILDTKPTIHDLPGARVLEKVRGHLAFEGVNFSYGVAGRGEEEGNAVAGISLEIKPGMKVALVGSSGAGKSTLLSLLLRFYDPQQGRILIDGNDLRDLTLDSLREQIGIVTQESFLFHDTIAENIRFGRPGATQAEIEEAAKLAHAHEFIMLQPRGYETVVGDKGCLLSGGQQQRLAIARALLKAAPVLLLDEATSALDSESERMIQDALERLAEGRTVIAIAHRLSTVLDSDMIVVMDGGRIAATGTHAELLNSSEVYSNLYRLQFTHAA